MQVRYGFMRAYIGVGKVMVQFEIGAVTSAGMRLAAMPISRANGLQR